MNIETIGDRLKRRRKELKMTQKWVAEQTGVSTGSVTQWELGYTSPKGENLIALSRALTCTPDWLLHGKEKSTKPDENAEWIGDIEPWESKTKLEDDEVELSFYTEVQLSAGSGVCEVRENYGPKLRFAKSTLRRQGVDPANAACVKVSGNSMEPVLPDGSTIGIDTASTTTIDGKMFAIDHDGMLRVKTLYRVPGGGIRLKSFNNEEFPDEVYSEQEAQNIRIIGKVFWYSVLI